MYIVTSITYKANRQAEMMPLGKVRRKAEAIAMADAQPIRTIVNPFCSAEIVHDNGKPHGGYPGFADRCRCPRCFP